MSQNELLNALNTSYVNSSELADVVDLSLVLSSPQYNKKTNNNP